MPGVHIGHGAIVASAATERRVETGGGVPMMPDLPPPVRVLGVALGCEVSRDVLDHALEGVAVFVEFAREHGCSLRCLVWQPGPVVEGRAGASNLVDFGHAAYRGRQHAVGPS